LDRAIRETKNNQELKFIQTLEYKLKTNLIPDIASAFFSSNQLEEDTKQAYLRRLIKNYKFLVCIAT